MTPPAPARTSPGTWIRAVLILADGSRVELRLPGVIAGSVGSYAPQEPEPPSHTVTKNGLRRRGRLTDLLGGS